MTSTTGTGSSRPAAAGPAAERSGDATGGGAGGGHRPGDGGAGRPRRVLRRIWDNLEEGALCALLVVMVLISFVTVVTRYLFDVPLSYIDQLVPNLFVWVTFLGASAAVKRRAHLGLSFVYDALPPRGRALLDLVSMLGTSAFFAATAWYGWKVVTLQLENHLMMSLGYPAWIVGLAVPAGSALFIVRAVEVWWRRRHEPPGAAPVTVARV